MSARCRIYAAALVAIGCIGGLSTSRLPAQPTATTNSAEPIRFRRVMVPNQRLDEWRPEGPIRYRPIRKAEFDRLIEALRDHPPEGNGAVTVRLTKAVYNARLTSTDLLEGQAQLEVVCPNDRGHDAPGMAEALLPLAPWRLPIHQAYWGNEPGQTALLGYSPAAPMSVLVEGSGTLRVDWTLRSARGPGIDPSYEFELPSCAVSTLLLDLPANLEPRPSKGALAESIPLDGQQVRWRIELGGASRFSLVLSKKDNPAQRKRLTLLRQSATYDFSARGVDLTTQLALEVHHVPLRQLTVVLDPGLRLLTAKQGETNLAWSETVLQKTGSSQVNLELPEPLLGSTRIRLGATTPAQLGKLWRLPSIHAEGVAWQEGKARLLIPEPLSIAQVSMADCRQSSIDPLATPLSGESLGLQFFTQSASIDLLLDYGRQQVSLSSGTLIELGDDQSTGRVVAELRVDEGQVFTLEATLAQHWTIDSVESDPPGRVREFNINSDGSRQRTLQIQLSSPLDPSQPLRLIATGHRSAVPPGQVIGLAEFRMIEFANVRIVDPLMAVRTVAGTPLRLQNAEELTHLEPNQLSPAAASLFLEPPRGLLFRVDAKSEGLGISLEHEAPKYIGELDVDALVTAGPIWETTTVRVSPQNGPVQRILVRFFQPRSDEPVWSFGDEGTTALTARRLIDAEQPAMDASSQGETWELTFPRPLTEPFLVRAVRSAAGSGPCKIDLVSLPEASSQQGRVAIRSAAEVPVSIQNQGLKPLPGQPISDVAVVRGAFRYLPDEGMASSPVSLQVSLDNNAWKQATGLIWDFSVDSRLTPDGHFEHLARLRLQSHGQLPLELSLPPQSNVLGVWVDEQRVPQAMIGNKLIVALPTGQAIRTVSCNFAELGEPFSTWGRVSIPRIEVNLPTVERRCRLWLPPGYRLADSRGLKRPHDASLLQRLFGPLAREPRALPFDPRFAEEWRNLPDLPVGSLRARGQASSDVTALDRDNETAGWTAYSVSTANPDPVQVLVVRDGVQSSLGWGLFLLVTVLFFRKPGTRFSTLLMLASLSAAAALVLPDLLAPLASCAMLGMLCCLVLNVLRTISNETPRGRSSIHKIRMSDLSKTGAAVGCLFVAVFVGSGNAEEPPPAAVAPPPVHQVLVPVDEQGNFDGSYFHLPESLYNQLRRRTARIALQPQGWLLERADYRVDLTSTPQQRLSVLALKLDYDLRVFDSNTRIRLPLNREKSGLLPDNSVQIDGRAISAEWEDNGQLLCFDLPAGRFHAELVLKPQVTNFNDLQGFDLSIPPQATARLEVHVPKSAPAVELLSTTGRVTTSDEDRRLSAELGPAETLSLRWHEAGLSRGIKSNLDVEALHWLRIQPGTVVLHAKLKIKSLEGSIKELQLAADPSLQLLSLEGPKSHPLQTRVLLGSPQLITVEFARPVSEPITLEATLWLTGTSGVGNLRFPQFEPLATRSLRRMLGVSIDPGLEFEESGVAGLSRLSPADFLANWGASEAPPQLAYRLPADAIPAWTLLTRPRRTFNSVDQTLYVDLSAGRAQLQYEAFVTAPPGTNFQHRVLLPNSVQIERVSVVEDGIQRLARTARDESGLLTIFLTSPAAGPQEIRLHGFVAAPSGGNWTLPIIELEGAELRSARVQIRRQPDVLVDIRQHTGLVEETERARENSDPKDGVAKRGRLVGAWSVGGANYGMTLQLSPNRPKFDATQQTLIHREKGAWHASVDCRLRVRAGVVDRLQFDVPSAWVEPLRVTPTIPFEIVERPNRAGRQLVLRPTQPLRIESGEYRLSISGALNTAPGFRLQAPVIRLQGAEAFEHLLILPSQVDEQAVSWVTRGLLPADLPTDLASTPGWAPAQAYRVIDGPFLATMQSGHQTSDGPHVKFADIHIAWEEGGLVQGVAIFDLDPAGSTHCPLALPDRYTLTRVTIAGEPVLLEAAGKNQWNVMLASDELPQSIEVVFRGQLPDLSTWWRENRLLAPTLGDVPVDRTIWTIHGPENTSIAAPGLRASDALQHELLRAKAISKLAELAEKTGAGMAPDDLSRWYLPFARRMQSSLTDVEILADRLGDPQLAQEVQSEVKTLRQRQLQIAQQLGLMPVLGQLAGQPSPDSQTGALWANLAGKSKPAIYCSFEGGVAALNLRRDHNPVDPWLARGGLAVALVGAAFGMVQVGRLRPASFWRPWRHFLGVALGFVWWLWLTPSVLGLLLIGLGLLAVGRSAVGSWRARGHGPLAPA